MKKILLISLLITQSIIAQKQQKAVLADDLKAQKKWVNKQLKAMDLDQKIGQLFMVAAFTKPDKDNTRKISEHIENYHIGGVIFSKGSPYKQAKFTNRFQDRSRTPLLIGMDAEWGLAMRLDSTYAFPYNLTLGAIQDNDLVRKIGKQIGKHNRRLGVHINFAPVLDINTNPKNPIIGNRSFGEDKFNVTQKASALMKGMQDAGILTCGKHFPGHGDTDADSHKTLPTVDYDRDRVERIELYPYKELIPNGLNAVMVAHLNMPKMTGKNGLPTSLSKKMVHNGLKKELGFSGLIISDAMNMKGVTNFNSDQPSIVKAFQAGIDILLIPDDLPKNFTQIKTAIKNGIISERRLDYSVRKILFAKYKAGLNENVKVDQKNLTKDLNTSYNEALTYQAFAEAATLVKNDLGSIPFQSINKKTGLLLLGTTDTTVFENEIAEYETVEKLSAENVAQNINSLENYDRVIISYHQDTSTPWYDHRLSNSAIELIDKISTITSVVFVNFSSPYALSGLKSTLSVNAILNLYQNNRIAQKVAASILYGGRRSKGKLPVSVSRAFPEGSGVKSQHLGRLYEDMPQNAGLNVRKLAKVDSLVNLAIEEEQAPGVQMLIAKSRKIVYRKNFGHFRYDQKKPVTDSTLYDLASLTKILSTLPVVMHLYEHDQLNFETTIGELLTQYKESNKEDINLKRMLSHYARLKDWIPFYRSTLDDREKYYREESSDSFSIKLTDKLYLRSDYKDSIQQRIIESPLNDSLVYDYSDLPFYMLKDYIEQHFDESLAEVADRLFYQPLGNELMLFHPLEKYNSSLIAPSYVDDTWREQEIQGIVQDQGAAMLGGVGGHAGLFANARNVAKMMQLYLNGGQYGGKRYFNESTINAFNTCYYCEEDVRRGLGFDKPQLDDVGPTCGCISMSSFGHSGYTGAYTWADPEEDLIYVFLTNRTYPDIDNDKLVKENTRTEIQQQIYEALED